MNKKPARMIALTGATLAVLAVGGTAYAATPAAAPSTPVHHSVSTARTGNQNTTGTDGTADQNTGTENAEPTNGTEETSPETDGPGGHADTNGANVDHQFNGTE